MKCEKCGSEIPENYLFCPECGTKTPLAPIDEKPEIIPGGLTENKESDTAAGAPFVVDDRFLPAQSMLKAVVGKSSYILMIIFLIATIALNTLSSVAFGKKNVTLGESIEDIVTSIALETGLVSEEDVPFFYGSYLNNIKFDANATGSDSMVFTLLILIGLIWFRSSVLNAKNNSPINHGGATMINVVLILTLVAIWIAAAFIALFLAFFIVMLILGASGIFDTPELSLIIMIASIIMVILLAVAIAYMIFEIIYYTTLKQTAKSTITAAKDGIIPKKISGFAIIFSIIIFALSALSLLRQLPYLVSTNYIANSFSGLFDGSAVFKAFIEFYESLVPDTGVIITRFLANACKAAFFLCLGITLDGYKKEISK